MRRPPLLLVLLLVFACLVVAAAVAPAADPAPVGKAPTAAHEWRDMGHGRGFGWGLKGFENDPPAAGCSCGPACPCTAGQCGAACCPTAPAGLRGYRPDSRPMWSYGTYAGPQPAGQRLLYFAPAGGCANGACYR